MKKFRSILFGLTCLIAVVGAFAFKAPNAQHKKGDVTYHYTSSSDQLADMQNPLLWVVESSGCNASGDIPCGIIYSDVRQDFDQYLSEFETAEEITAAADDRKFKP